MSYSTFSKTLRDTFRRILLFIARWVGTPKITLMIPFSSTDPKRQANFQWLQEYWKHELPEAEVVIGISKSEIFCKAEALNDAVAKSRGKVLVIMDADAYIDGNAIRKCANMILKEKNNLWFVPYRRLYRLNETAARLVTDSHPSHPYRFPQEVSEGDIENNVHSIRYGHHYGAMSMMFPRKAYDVIGRFDERFKGWGGEDVCLLRALDTLFGKHKTLEANMFHLWHPFYGDDYISRRWAGQDSGGSNWVISKQYGKAMGNPSMMKEIVDDGVRLIQVTQIEKVNESDPFIELWNEMLGIH